MSQRIFKLLSTSISQVLILYCVYTWGVEEDILTLEGKIVGGSKAKITNFPHAVYLSMLCGDYGMICGSSIVNQVILVTAAHCLQCKYKLHINAHAGDADIREVTVVRKVIKMIPHPQFSNTTLRNDIGLLLLSRNLPLGSTMKRVIIKSTTPAKASAYVAGWGITNDISRKRPFILKKVKVPLVPQFYCSVVGQLYPGMMCAGTTQSTENRPSHGDSGSALITTDYQEIGIVSFRTKPFTAMLMYTNVSYYYSWIQKKAKKLYCSNRI